MLEVGKTKESLEKDRGILKEYLLSKFNSEDWHGVQDAASDLRDIDSALAAMQYTILKMKEITK